MMRALSSFLAKKKNLLPVWKRGRRKGRGESKSKQAVWVTFEHRRRHPPGEMKKEDGRALARSREEDAAAAG